MENKSVNRENKWICFEENGNEVFGTLADSKEDSIKRYHYWLRSIRRNPAPDPRCENVDIEIKIKS